MLKLKEKSYLAIYGILLAVFVVVAGAIAAPQGTSESSGSSDWGLVLGHSDLQTAGSIRFDGGDFQGYDGSRWKSLTAAPDVSSNTTWMKNGNSIYYNRGYVGIGKADPRQSLDVYGGIRLGWTNRRWRGTMRWTGSDFEGFDGSSWKSFTAIPEVPTSTIWMQDGNDISYTQGRVGIGTANAQYALDVLGMTHINGRLLIGEGVGQAMLYDNDYRGFRIDTENGLRGMSMASSGVAFGDNNSSSSFRMWLTGGGGTSLILNPAAYKSSRIAFLDGSNVGWSLVNFANSNKFQIRNDATWKRLNLDRSLNMTLDGNLSVKGAGASSIAGSLGIGTDEPKARVQVEDGDVYLKSPGSGIILTSPNGSCFKVWMKNSGKLKKTSIACP